MNTEILTMTASIILALIAVLVALGSTYSAHQYRAATHNELNDLRTKMVRMESELQYRDNRIKALTEENIELLKKLVHH